MEKFKASYVFGSIIFLVLIVGQPAFAERNFSFEKVVDINKEALQNSLTDLQALPKIFPENVKSVESKIKTDDRTVAKMVFGVSGFSVNSEIELKNYQASQHTMEIISGDLKGTKLFTALKETWGYDGSPNQGTIVEIDMTLQTSGYLSLIGLAPDEAILYSLDKSLLDIVSYAKSNNDVEKQEPESSSDQNDADPSPSKRKFRR